MWSQNWQRGGNSWHYVVFIPEILDMDFDFSLCGFTSLWRGSPNPSFFSFPKLYLIPVKSSQAEQKRQLRTCFPEGVWDALGL